MMRSNEIVEFLLQRQQQPRPFALMGPYSEEYHIRIDVEFLLKEVAVDGSITFTYRIHESLEGNTNGQIHLLNESVFQTIENLAEYLSKKRLDFNVVRPTHL
jgi:hypothetical protein